MKKERTQVTQPAHKHAFDQIFLLEFFFLFSFSRSKFISTLSLSLSQKRKNKKQREAELVDLVGKCKKQKRLFDMLLTFFRIQCLF